MKVLCLYETYFKLPDDFNGTYSDALRLLADYHDSDTAKHRREIVDTIGLEIVLWDEFLEAVDDGLKHVAMPPTVYDTETKNVNYKFIDH